LDTLIKAFSELRNIFVRLEVREDAASLAARRGIALTLSYLGDLTSGSSPGREQQKALAEAWGEAAGKVRRIDQRLEREFQSFSEFWAIAGHKGDIDVRRTAEYVQRLLELLRQRNLGIAD
jgi:hypothetical protein